MAEEFPDDQWPEIRARAEAGGAPDVVAFVEAQPDPDARRALFSFAQRALASRDWQGKGFDVVIDVAGSGIAEALGQAETEEDPDRRAALLDAANVISYNLSAALAACWPGDETPRETRHFERGLAAAEACLRWREELGKGPFPFSIAWWAKGMHLISLGRAAEAVEAMGQSLEFGRRAAAEGAGREVAASEDFSVAIGLGYLGIARHLAGEGEGRAQYEEALAAFREMATNEEKREDAEFGIGQLEHVWGTVAAPA